MVMTDRIAQIFRDARELQASAAERLDQGDIRDAAEKAWGATKRATDALILAGTGREPEGGLLGLISPSSVCVALRGRRPEARKRGRRRGGSKIAEKMRAGVAAVRDPRAQAHLGVGMGAWRTANWMGRLPLGKVTHGPNGYGKTERWKLRAGNPR